MNKKSIGILVGSLRKGSYTRYIAEWIKNNYSTEYDIKIIEIGHLPIYNQDYDVDYPQVYQSFKKEVASSDALIFVTAEHNRSIPAVLKNALDIGSRPWGQTVWSGKPAFIISQSVGALGGFGATHHLRQVLAFLNVIPMGQPECYIGNSAEAIDENGSLSERTANYLKSLLDSFRDWIVLHQSK